MFDRTRLYRALGAAAFAAVTLAACKPGEGRNDTLADGATDRASANDGSTGIGPGAPPVDSASPAEGNSASQPAGNAPPGAAAGPTLMVATQGAHAAHGGHLTNAAGNALYYVEGDTDGSKCTGPCLQSWPPVVIADAQPTGAPGMQGAQIATITRPEGTRQVTFNGHPLYRYAADAGAGATNGDGVKDKFGTWHVATAQMAAGAHAGMDHGTTGSSAPATGSPGGTPPKGG